MARDREQSLLNSVLDEVATRGQAPVLRGEPGVGKSRLLSDAAQTARKRGMSVLTTTGVQSEAHLPFAGLHQLLRPVRGRVADVWSLKTRAAQAEIQPGDIVLPLKLLDLDGKSELAFFSTISTFGTAADITLAELAIEAFYPANAHTAMRLLRDVGAE